MKQLSANVYLEGDIPACNLGLITTREGLVMIDAPMSYKTSMQWSNEISSKGEVRYLVNTEEHFDHYRGTRFFPGVLISHQATREILEQISADEMAQAMKDSDPKTTPSNRGPKVRLADITFNESLNIYLGNHTFRLIHLPGHATGGIGIHIPEERVVFVSDCIFNGEKSWLHESVPELWLKSLNKIAELDVDVIVPGHGPVCTKEYLNQQADIIQQWINVIKDAIKRGIMEEEAMDKIIQPDPYPLGPNKPINEIQLNRDIVARLYRLYSV